MGFNLAFKGLTTLVNCVGYGALNGKMLV